jgi:hypothetical protein
VEARNDLQLRGVEGHGAADLVRAEAANADDVGGERRGVGGAASGGPAGERLKRHGVTASEQLEQCAMCLRRAAGAARDVPAASGRSGTTELFYDGKASGGTRRAELGGVRWRRLSVSCSRGRRSIACGGGRRWRICAEDDGKVGPMTAKRGGRLGGVRGGQGWRSSWLSGRGGGVGRMSVLLERVDFWVGDFFSYG